MLPTAKLYHNKTLLQSFFNFMEEFANAVLDSEAFLGLFSYRAL